MIISRSILFLFLFSIVFLMFFHPINAIIQDLGRHVLLGEIIVQTKTVPKTNLLSYTYSNFPFINTHWFSEVLFYLITKASGFLGLLVVMSVIAASSFIIQILYIKKFHIVPILVASLLYFRVLLERTELRPEIFSFLFLSIFIVVLYKYRSGFTRLIYILPFIQLLWVNTHIYFPLGVFVIGLFLIDQLINQGKKINRNIIILGIIFFSSAIATVFNPNGFQGAFYPLHVFQNYGFEVEENHNVFNIWNHFQQKTTILYFFISIFFLFLLLFSTIKKTKPFDWFLAIFFSIFSISAERNLPLFVFGTFIAFASSLDILYKKYFTQQRLANKSLIIFIIVGCFVIWQTKDIVTFKPVGYELPKGFSGAVDFLGKNNISGPIFNNFDIGSYLAYRLYPKEKVFVDGRPEAYPASFFQNEYIPMQQEKKRFEEADKKYHFNTIINSYTDPTQWNQQFLRDINANPNWKLVYLDSNAVIYIKNNSQNQEIKNTSIINSAELPKLQLTKDELIHLLLFYQNIGWTNEIKIVDKKLLELDPNFCFALLNLAQLLQNESNPEFMSYAIRYQNHCQ